MIKNATTWLVGAATLLVLAGGLYVYYSAMLADNMPPPAAAPDNSVNAGAIQSIAQESITIKKQDGTLATFGIASSTQLIIQDPEVAASGKAPIGKMALITPSAADAAMAGTIVIVSSPAP